MPTIIGAQDNGQAKTLADAFSRFADSTWGSGAQNAALRGAQTAEAQQRAYQLSDENQRKADFQKSMELGINPKDPHQIALAVSAGLIDKLAAARLYQSANTTGAGSATTAAAQVGAGQAFGNTATAVNQANATTQRGQDLGLQGTQYTADQSRAGAMDREKIASADRHYGDDTRARSALDVEAARGGNQQALELAKQGAETYMVPDPRAPGGNRTVSKAEAIRLGLPGVMTTDQTKAGILQGAVAGQQPQPQMPAPSFDGSALPTPPGLMGGQSFPVQAPNGNNLTATVDRPQPPAQPKPGGLQPNLVLGPNAPLMVQDLAGEKQTNIPMMEPGGPGMKPRQGVSRDGGQTVTLTDGTTVPAAGFLPAGPESALNQGRFNNIVAQDQPWLQRNQNADPAKSGAMAAVLKLGGPGQLVGNEVNTLLGATGLSKILTPMIAKDTAAAQQNVQVWNEQMIKGLGVSSNPGVKEQNRITDRLLLDDSFLQNPAQNAMRIPALANALVQRNDVLHKQLQNIPDPSSPRVAQLMQDIAENEKALDMLTDPNWGNKPFDVVNGPTNAVEQQNGRTGNNPDGTPKAAPPPTATGPNGEKVQWNGTAWVPLNGQ